MILPGWFVQCMFITKVQLSCNQNIANYASESFDGLSFEFEATSPHQGVTKPRITRSHRCNGADEKPDVTFQDVGGMDSQKQEIREAVELLLTQFDLYKEIGIDLREFLRCHCQSV